MNYCQYCGQKIGNRGMKQIFILMTLLLVLIKARTNLQYEIIISQMMVDHPYEYYVDDATINEQALLDDIHWRNDVINVKKMPMYLEKTFVPGTIFSPYNYRFAKYKMYLRKAEPQ